MTKSVPLTEARADAILDEMYEMLMDIGDGNEIGERFTSCLYGHKLAFLSLCEAFEYRSQETIAGHMRRDILAEFLPVVGPIVQFNGQLCDLHWVRNLYSGWLDNEICSDGNRSNRFVLRKLPYVVFRSLRRTRLMHLVQRVNQEVDFPNATVWDVLAVLRSCRRRLPRKCAICVMRQCSWLSPKYERDDDSAVFAYSYMTFFLDGTKLAIRNVNENDFVPENTLFLNYVASTVDLLA